MRTGKISLKSPEECLKKAISRKKAPKIPYAALRRLLKKVLDSSYDGCESDLNHDGCIHCGSINCDVSEFVDKYIRKRKMPRICASCSSWGLRGECELTREEVGGVESVSFHLGSHACVRWSKRQDKLPRINLDIIRKTVP